MKKVIKIFFNIIHYIILSYIELCCSYCYYKNIHCGHKLLEVNDEESLKKENISLEDSKKEFNEIMTKSTELKEKIENQISEINNLYKKIDEEVSNSFKSKHEKLQKEEKDLKEKLQNEVTKVKEGLENFLTLSNENIRENEKIQKGLEKLEKNNEKNMIKILSYISKINKNNKESKKLFQELMRNLKLEFIENETNIKYTDYYFNGIPSPKNIEINDIQASNININWKIDNLNILNMNNNNIKFKIELRKNKEKFSQVYDGNETNFKINNLIENTDYEVKICSYYDNLFSNWSEIKKFKTIEGRLSDSQILKETKREKEFVNKIYEWTNYNRMELIYRGSRDGMTTNSFHNKCDNKNPTIVLYKNTKDSVFGGYTSLAWQNSGDYRPDPKAFIFTLINIHNSEPTKFTVKSENEGVYHNSSYGPTFGDGCDISIGISDFLNSDANTDFPCRYNDSLGKGKSIFTGDFNNDNAKFRLKEIEVFQLFK